MTKLDDKRLQWLLDNVRLVANNQGNIVYRLDIETNVSVDDFTAKNSTIPTLLDLIDRKITPLADPDKIDIAMIVIKWREPLDVKVWGYGTRIDNGGWIVQLYRDRTKLTGGSDSGTFEFISTRAIRHAKQKGFTHYMINGGSVLPVEGDE